MPHKEQSNICKLTKHVACPSIESQIMTGTYHDLISDVFGMKFIISDHHRHLHFCITVISQPLLQAFTILNESVIKPGAATMIIMIQVTHAMSFNILYVYIYMLPSIGGASWIRTGADPMQG